MKKQFWYVIGAIGLVAVAVFFRDTALGAAIQSFLRRKKVEDEVRAIEEKIAVKDARLANNKEELVILAEEMAKSKIDATKASEAEIKEFYAKLFETK